MQLLVARGRGHGGGAGTQDVAWQLGMGGVSLASPVSSKGVDSLEFQFCGQRPGTLQVLPDLAC